MARELTGDLPCVRCRYNLRGLTVRGMCPECGTSVRTTLLAKVDPMAKELRPISFPRITAAGMMLWSFGALIAALAAWSLRLAEIGNASEPLASFRWAVVWGTAASGVGAVALVRPQAGLAVLHRSLAAVAVLAYVPLVLLQHAIHLRADMAFPRPYLNGTTLDAWRPLLRLAASACILLILFGLRPNARQIAARWLLMRIGVIDRQTLLTMGAVVLAWSLGDGIILLAGSIPAASTLLRIAGQFVVLFASLLFTVGLFSVVIDTYRLTSVVLQPPLDLDDLTTERRA